MAEAGKGLRLHLQAWRKRDWEFSLGALFAVDDVGDAEAATRIVLAARVWRVDLPVWVASASLGGGFERLQRRRVDVLL